jgi:hypothetical protein
MIDLHYDFNCSEGKYPLSSFFSFLKDKETNWFKLLVEFNDLGFFQVDQDRILPHIKA